MFKNYFEKDTAKCLIIKTRRKFISVYLLIIKKGTNTEDGTYDYRSVPGVTSACMTLK